jgi:ribosomal protein S18 acetylase RimI-like enzyme
MGVVPVNEGVVRAGSGDEKAIARVLASAFLEDPVWSWLIPRSQPMRRLELLFGAVVRHSVVAGHAYMTEDRNAVALWSPPGQWKLSTPTLIRSVPAIVGAAGVRLPRLIGRLNAIERHHAKQQPEHWYLEFLATDRNAQGRGLGTALLHNCLSRFDLPVYLESSNPRNLAFYQRSGFLVADVLEFRRGPRQWTLWGRPDRRPATPKAAEAGRRRVRRSR